MCGVCLYTRYRCVQVNVVCINISVHMCPYVNACICERHGSALQNGVENQQRFRILSLGFSVQGFQFPNFGIWGFGFLVFGSRVLGLGFPVSSFWILGIWGFGFWVLGFGFLDFGFWVQGIPVFVASSTCRSCRGTPSSQRTDSFSLALTSAWRSWPSIVKNSASLSPWKSSKRIPF